MISTTLAVLDGFPRAVEGALLTLRTEGAPLRDRSAIYWMTLAICAVGALAILSAFTGQLKALVDLATALTGLTAPAFALLNWRVVCGDEVPHTLRPSALYSAYHLAGIAFLTAMAVAYMAVQIGVL